MFALAGFSIMVLGEIIHEGFKGSNSTKQWNNVNVVQAAVGVA